MAAYTENRTDAVENLIEADIVATAVRPAHGQAVDLVGNRD